MQLRVHPALVPQGELLANVDGVLNAVQIEGDLMDRVLFQGPGAGSLPTTSAVVADALDAAVSISNQVYWPHSFRREAGLAVMPIDDVVSRYYLRIGVADRPGVLAHLARVLADAEISIASVIQKEAGEGNGAEIVIMTHDAREAAMRGAIDDDERSRRSPRGGADVAGARMTMQEPQSEPRAANDVISWLHDQIAQLKTQMSRMQQQNDQAQAAIADTNDSMRDARSETARDDREDAGPADDAGSAAPGVRTARAHPGRRGAHRHEVRDPRAQDAEERARDQGEKNDLFKRVQDLERTVGGRRRPAADRRRDDAPGCRRRSAGRTCSSSR